MNLISAYCTDAGALKHINQDSLCIKSASYNGSGVFLAAVCDGLGGLSDGETASAYVISKLSEWFDTCLPGILDSEAAIPGIRRSIDEELHKINNSLNRYSDITSKTLGTTMTGLLASEAHKKIITFHIGDTRIYSIHNDNIKTLTNDHSVIADEVREGKLSPEEAENDPRQNQLTKCMGAGLDMISFDYSMISIETDCVYLICSDGFRKKISSAEIHSALCPSEITDDTAAEKKLSELTSLCIQRGESDNISSVIIKTSGKGGTSD
ncbi:MAG: serine/threonine-protein phosphatase [Ruminococcus sp.]|nr:serine/threonine-protein phosphatase [Ruminococcus sp.]